MLLFLCFFVLCFTTINISLFCAFTHSVSMKRHLLFYFSIVLCLLWFPPHSQAKAFPFDAKQISSVELNKASYSSAKFEEGGRLLDSDGHTRHLQENVSSSSAFSKVSTNSYSLLPTHSNFYISCFYSFYAFTLPTHKHSCYLQRFRVPNMQHYLLFCDWRK